MTALRGLRTRLRTDPLRPVLIVLQVTLATLATTVALSTSRVANSPTEGDRFDVVAANESENFAQFYLFEPERLTAIADLVPSVASLAIYQAMDMPTLELGETLYAVRSGAVVSPAYFDIADIEMIAGSAFPHGSGAGAQGVVAISESVAEQLFGGEDAVGATVRLLPQRVAYRVEGVYRRAGARPDDDVPAMLASTDTQFSVQNRSTTLAVLARPGQRATAETELLAAIRSVYAAELSERGLAPGQDLVIAAAGQAPQGHGRGRNQLDLAVLSLFGVVAVIVGAIGTFSLTVTEMVERRRQIAMLRALGATRLRIGAEAARDTAILAAIGGLLGVGLALAVVALAANAPAITAAGTRIAFDAATAAATVIGIVLLSALMALLPALRAVQLPPVNELREA